MSRMPLPRGRNYAFKAVVLRIPPQFALYLLAGRDERCGIAGTTSFDFSFDFQPRHFFRDVNDLFDAETVAVAEIVIRGLSAVFEIVESADMQRPQGR